MASLHRLKNIDAASATVAKENCNFKSTGYKYLELFIQHFPCPQQTNALYL